MSEKNQRQEEHLAQVASTIKGPSPQERGGFRNDKQVDLNDILIAGGLILLAIGLGMVSIPLASGVMGGILLAMGLFGAWRKSK